MVDDALRCRFSDLSDILADLLGSFWVVFDFTGAFTSFRLYGFGLCPEAYFGTSFRCSYFGQLHTVTAAEPKLRRVGGALAL